MPWRREVARVSEDPHAGQRAAPGSHADQQAGQQLAVGGDFEGNFVDDGVTRLTAYRFPASPSRAVLPPAPMLPPLPPSPRLPPLLLLPWLVVAAVLGGGCDGRLQHRSESTLDGRAIVPAGTTRIVVRVPAGSLQVSPGVPGEVTFGGRVLRAADTAADLERLQALDMTLHASAGESPGELLLAAPGLPPGCSPESCRLVVPVQLRVPPDVEVHLVTPLGECSALEHRGGLLIETRRGTVKLIRCDGTARVRIALEGDVVVDQHRGGLDVHTARGLMVVYVAELRPPGVQLHSGDGRIYCYVPPAAAFTLEARTDDGYVMETFGLAAAAREGDAAAAGDPAQRKALRGDVNGGGPKVEISTGRGGIAVRANE